MGRDLRVQKRLAEIGEDGIAMILASRTTDEFVDFARSVVAAWRYSTARERALGTADAIRELVWRDRSIEDHRHA